MASLVKPTGFSTHAKRPSQEEEEIRVDADSRPKIIGAMWFAWRNRERFSLMMNQSCQEAVRQAGSILQTATDLRRLLSDSEIKTVIACAKRLSLSNTTPVHLRRSLQAHFKPKT